MNKLLKERIMEIRKFAPPDEDRTVFKTNLVRVFVPKRPHTHAEYGGHLVIQTLEPHAFRGEFSEDERHETMVLSQAVEALMMTILGAQFCNLQDNGNWAFLSGGSNQRRCHLHVYGRGPEEDQYDGPGYQRWGMSLNFPHPTELARINGEPDPAGAVWLDFIHPYSSEQIAPIEQHLPGLYQNYLECGD